LAINLSFKLRKKAAIFACLKMLEIFEEMLWLIWFYWLEPQA